MKVTVMRKNVIPPPRLIGGALAFVACLQTAYAAVYEYTGPSGGYFNIPANWTPTGPPASSDTAVFDRSGYTSVYFGELATTTKDLTVAEGDVTLMLGVPASAGCMAPVSYDLLGSDSFVKTAARVGTTAGQTASLKLFGGTSECAPPGYVNAGGMVLLGQADLSEGALELGDQFYDYEGPVIWTSPYPTWVGSNGVGRLEVHDESELNNGSGILGVTFGSAGHAKIWGTWANDGSLTIGKNGYGMVTVLGELSNTGDAYVGAEPGAEGTVFVSKNGSYSGDWFCHGDLVVGGDDTGPGGEGLVWTGGGHVRVWRDTTVWSSGLINVFTGSAQFGDVDLRNGGEIAVDGGEFEAAELDVFYNGTLTANGGVTACANLNAAGTIDVDGGTLEVTNQLYHNSSCDINLTSSGTINAGTLTGCETAWNWVTGSINVTNDSLSIDSGEPFGDDLQITGHKSLSVSDTLFVGPTTNGTLTIGSGAAVESGAGVVGNASGVGSAILTGANTDWTMANTLMVRGAEGTQLSVANGAKVFNNNAYIAAEAGTTAQVALSGSGTQWKCGGSLYAGGDSATAGGTGMINVDNGAKLIVGGTTKIWDGFAVEIDNGIVKTPHLDLTGDVAVHGSGILDLSGGPLDISNSGTLNGAIVGDGWTPVALYDAGSTWTMPGSLLIGSGDYGSGHIHALSLAPGATVTVEQDVTVLNILATTLNGGTINAELFDMLAANFHDFGTVNGDFWTAGTVTATGDLTVGNLNSSSGVQIGSGLTVGPHHVTLNHQGLLFTGSSTSIAGGTLTVPNGLGLTSSDHVTGHGVIETPDDPTKSLTNDGAILGNSAVEQIELTGYIRGLGTLNNVTILGTDSPGYTGPAGVSRGNVTYAGTVEIQIGGLTPGTKHDQITHKGTANLGGELSIELVDGFKPLPGDSFTIMTFKSGTGEFEFLNGQTINNAGGFEIIYGENDVTLVTVANMSGDCDMDNDADLDDFGILAECLAGPDIAMQDGCTCFDMDDSGTVDLADLALFQKAFSGPN